MGTPITQILTSGPKSGEQIAADLCGRTAVPRRMGGIHIPQPGGTEAARKVSYLLAAESTP
jgi:hypothetical protein